MESPRNVPSQYLGRQDVSRGRGTSLDRTSASSRPRRRRDPSPPNIRVASAASPRLSSSRNIHAEKVRAEVEAHDREDVAELRFALEDDLLGQ